MKLIDTLNEALGVPSGILDVANTIYKNIINTKLLKYNLNDLNNEGFDANSAFNRLTGEFRIGDEIYNSIKIYINVSPHPKSKFVDYIKMAIAGDIGKSSPTKIRYRESDEIIIIIQFVCPGNEDMDPLISDKNIIDGIRDILSSKKNELISTISHEIKHSYDQTKKKGESLIRMGKYQSVNELINVNIKPIREFCYALYYASLTESLVRPTEVLSLIRSGGITKKGFLNFIKSNETYVQLNKIRGMSYDKFYQSLIDNIDNIKEILSNEDISIDINNDKMVIDFLLTNVRLNLQHNTMEFIEGMILNGMPRNIALLLNRREEINFLKKVSKNVMKYDDNKTFYTKEINDSVKQANIMIRKIAKLYDLADD